MTWIIDKTVACKIITFCESTTDAVNVIRITTSLCSDALSSGVLLLVRFFCTMALDFTMNRVLVNLFKAYNIEIIEEYGVFPCQTAICTAAETFSEIFIIVVIRIVGLYMWSLIVIFE